MLSKLKYTFRRWSGQYKHLRLDTTLNKTWIGSNYGGFYAYLPAIPTGSTVVSVGIGMDISFGRELIERTNCQVFGFDPTPKSIEWIAEQDLPQGYHFYPYGLGMTTGEVDFYLPKNPAYVSGSLLTQDFVSKDDTISVPMKSFEDIVREHSFTSIDVLKMDIEGAEYQLLPAILSQKVPIGQLLVEFHDRYFTDGKAQTIAAIEQLRAHGYRLFGVSSILEELSFIHESKLP